MALKAKNLALVAIACTSLVALKHNNLSLKQLLLKLNNQSKQSKFVVAAIIALVYMQRTMPKKVLKNKYPKHYPIIGAMPSIPDLLYDAQSYSLRTFRLNNFEAGDTVILWEHFLSVIDRNDIKHVLKDNFKNYPKNVEGSDGFGVVFKELLGDGIFAVDGEKWKKQRKVASYLFSNGNLRDNVLAVFQAHSQLLINHLKENKGKTFDLQSYWSSFTFDAFCELAFGYNPHALKSAFKGERLPFLVAFDEAQNISTRRFSKVPFVWKSQRFLNVGEEAILKKRVQELDSYVYQIIEERISDMDESKEDLESKGDLLSLFMVHCQNDRQYLEPKFLRDLIINFMIAGRDTTACTLTNFFRLLSENPSIESDLCSEFKQLTPKMEGVTLDQLKKASFADCCFNETVRMFPPIGTDIRLCMEDDVLPSGIFVQKGTQISLNTYALGRNPKQFKHPNTFDPNRWRKRDGGKYVDRIPDEYTLPIFLGGSRICLGKQMARLETKVVASMILRSGVRIRIQPGLRDDFVTGPAMFYKQNVWAQAV